MTTMKNIIMVLVALFLVLSFAPVSAADVENLTNAAVIAEVTTPTPIPTLESMAHARVMSDGSMYPNYKVKEFNLKDEIPDYSKFGYAVFYVRAGGSALDLNVWAIKDGKNVTAFDATYHPDKTEIEGQNKDYTLVKVLPDGQSDLTKLDAGDWTAYMQNGNGGQMETKKFKVGNGDITRVAFLGHAVSSSEEHKVVYTITKATYGMQKIVIDREAQPEIPAVTHQDYETGHVHAKKFNGNGWGDFYDEGHRYKITTNQNDPAFIVHGYFCAHKAHMVTIIDTPVIPATPAVTHVEGEYAPVTSQIQQVVNGGVLSFIFDNRPSNGGIFAADGITLLKGIVDPAPGQVKTVHIEYTIDGSSRTVDQQEYLLITL